MPTSRKRRRTFGSQSGTFYNDATGSTTTRTVTPLHDEYIEDTVGNYPNPNGLWIRKRYFETLATASGSSSLFTLKNYPLDNQGTIFDHVLTDGGPSAVEAVTEVQARTNPSRPDVSMPNLIYELKDLPGLLQLEGERQLVRRATRKGKNSVAESEFGWQNTMRDLQGLFDFTGQVNRRVAELNSMYNSEPQGLQRRRTVFHTTGYHRGDPQTFQSFGCLVEGYIERKTTKRAWASVRWVPTGTTVPSADELLRQARLAVHGWDFSLGGLAATVWQSLPWSWFADYFANLGAYLDASRNSVGFVAEGGCYMVHTKTQAVMNITGVSHGFKATPGTWTLEDKERFLSDAGLTIYSQPFLGIRQLTTLSSIGLSLGKS